MSWDHGYVSSGQYTCGYYPELAPAWLDFAALFRGHASARTRPGDPFRYLELGSGMGYGLCLLAAVHPEGEFLGLDFHPDHVVHARELARRLDLANVRFLEADLLDVAISEDNGPLGGPGSWHYVVAHGLASWVVEPVQQALLAVASRALEPGGIVYCSYNCHPGWYAGSIFRQVARLEREASGQGKPHAPFEKAREKLNSLLGERSAPLPLGLKEPTLRSLLDRLPSEHRDYVQQEYGAAGWQPLWSSDFHRLCREHKLEPLGTATLSELLDRLLLPQLHATVLSESEPALRECLMDIATCKNFRRDLLVRGRRRLLPCEVNERLAAVPVRLQEAPPTNIYNFQTVFGEVRGDTKLYASIERKLATGPLTLGELADSLDMNLGELLNFIPLLLEAGRLGFDRGEAAEASHPVVAKATRILMELAVRGHPYGFLPAPAVGTAVSFGLVEMLLLKARSAGMESTALTEAVMKDLKGLGQELSDPQGQPLVNDQQRIALLQLAETTLNDRLPTLRSLGVFPAQGMA